jgi:2-polyprenyl-6-methoxyphenol hydroxylase-like FAD-dependent oxidoreductase
VLLGTEIVDCDPETGTLTSKVGEKYDADVIIAADGIRVSFNISAKIRQVDTEVE